MQSGDCMQHKRRGVAHDEGPVAQGVCGGINRALIDTVMAYTTGSTAHWLEAQRCIDENIS